jgi:prevent-host-death family protein
MISNIHSAKTNLSKLIEAALRGEEVVIAKAGKPAVRLVPVEPVSAETPGERLKRARGMWKGRFEFPSWEEWKAMDAEIEADFQESIDTPFPEPK